MAWTPHVPRHRADAPADSGASATFDDIVYANACAIGRAYGTVADVWAGNPDTDKFWAKGE